MHFNNNNKQKNIPYYGICEKKAISTIIILEMISRVSKNQGVLVQTLSNINTVFIHLCRRHITRQLQYTRYSLALVKI